MKKQLIPILALMMTNTLAADANLDAGVFNADSKLYYEIGGAKKISSPINGDRTNLRLGVSGNANLGYSCGDFDPKLAFGNTMDNFKNGVDDAVNTVIRTANSGVSALPSLVMQRAQPGLYDIFQDYKLDAEQSIDIATKSCQQMEAEIAKGDNPYADFVTKAKAQTWRDEVVAGKDIVQAQRKVDKDSNGITAYGGQKVGGSNQPPLKLVGGAVLAGYNFSVGNKNPLDNSSAPSDSQLGSQFASSQQAIDWATDVVGEYEINNKKPVTKVGTGLHKKLEQEYQNVLAKLSENEYQTLGINRFVQAKIEGLNYNKQDIIKSNLAEEIAVQRVIDKALIIRRLLLMGSQDNDMLSNNRADQLNGYTVKLEKEIESIMFERKVKQDLTNKTIIKILEIPTPRDTGLPEVQDKTLLD